MAEELDKAALKEARGAKRVCPNCDTRYYDLNREPIICPSCGTEFIVAGQEPELVEEDQEVELDVVAAEAGAEIVSLEDVDEGGEDIPDVDGVDDIDDTPINNEDDNTFLETDDDDTDIAFDVKVSKDDES